MEVTTERGPRPAPYWNPYVCGFFLGVTLLASFTILGAGLGGSGGLARFSAALECSLVPEHVKASEYFGKWGEDPLRYYLVFMLLGTVGGGAISAALAGRSALTLERGAACSIRRRVGLAVLGGVLVGFASRLAQGCTSGQALSGGAMLLDGSLAFLVCAFGGGYAVAYFFRRQWHD